MNRINFSRRTLYIVLSIVLISVFTLTIAYAALSVTLNISGSAEVASSNWDVHLDNVKVAKGSVSGNVPTITNGITVSFSTNLTTPGDFYEFTIDVVNDGSIDAMINSINKSPTLSAAQAKYLKYEITYQNGESINTKQLVKSGSFVRLMVRVEFRKDINPSDLPSAAESLNLSFSVNYVQSDGSGSDVNNNGAVISNPKFAVGEEFCIGDECFYVLEDDGTIVTAITKYNLEVGEIVTGPFLYDSIDEPSGIQSKTTLLSEIECSGGMYTCLNPSWLVYGTTDYYGGDFEEENYPADIYRPEFEIAVYVNNYVNYIVSLGGNVLNSRLITLKELNDFGCTVEDCTSAPAFLKDLVYWTGTASDLYSVYYVNDSKLYSSGVAGDEYTAGVRPVLEFATSDF